MNQNQKDNVIAIVSSSLLFCHKLAHDIKAQEPTAKESKAAYEINPVVNNLTNAVVVGIDTVLKEDEEFCTWKRDIDLKTLYRSGCGKDFFEADSLSSVDIKFCFFCGLKIKEED